MSALAYSAADEAEADGQAIVTLTLEDGSAATLIVTLEDGEPAAVASDAFSAAPSYVASEGGGGPFEVTGLDERPCRGDGDDLAPLSVLPHLLSPFYPVCLSAQVNELIPVDILQTSPGLGSWM